MGVSFQALAIARAIIDVYQGRLDYVRPEVPPRADFGESALASVAVDDFVVGCAGVRTYHQVKSNAPGGGNWTVRKLWQEQILQQFKDQLDSDPMAECCLVTPSDCPLLGELANRARDAFTAREFEGNLTGGLRALVEEARKKLGTDSPDMYVLLRRCRLERTTPDQFSRQLESLACALFADPVAATACLHSMAMRAMSTGQPLDRASINAVFLEHSVFAKPRATEGELLAAVKGASSRLRTSGTDIAGIHILQPVVDQLLEWVHKADSTGPTVAVLLDHAGAGKTVAMSVLLSRLELAGTVALGIKVDGLAFSTQADLAAQLGFEDSVPSVLQSLRRAGHVVALLIDQVDALSCAMSRDSTAITVVLDLVARVAGLGIPIVLACRSSDWNYDHHLRDLRDKKPATFALRELSDSQLEKVLSVCSLSPEKLHPVTLKVVRCPLRLRLLVEVVLARREADPCWSPRNAIYTLQSLYQEFWTLKLGKANPSGIDPADCEEVATAIARSMHASQHLSAPESMVAGSRRAADWLTSEAVLDRHGKLLSFFHQTFFDFIFARWFVAGAQGLGTHLLQTDQGLFYRPMVRQILEYLRDLDSGRYIAELGSLLQDSRIREHLRWVTIGWVAEHADPRPEELGPLQPILAAEDSRGRLLGSFRRNAAWFDILGLGRLRQWLGELPEAQVWAVVRFLESIISERQQDVVSLLAPHLGKSKAWNGMVAYSLGGIEGTWDQCSVDLLCALLRSPTTELIGEFARWAEAVESLGKASPHLACEAVGIVLDRFTGMWTRAPDEAADEIAPGLLGDAPRLPKANEFCETLDILARDAPAQFLRRVLPWTLAAMYASCYSYSNASFKDDWRYWSLEHDAPRGTPERLLNAIRTAAVALARTDPPSLRALLRPCLDSHLLAMQAIAAQSYAANPSEFASDAASFLSSDPRRLRIALGGARGWDTRELIEACCPHWTDEQLGRVETAVLTMKTYPATSVDDLRRRGTEHLRLLRAFDRQRLSGDGLNRLGQLERKFPRVNFPSPFYPRVRMIGSRIPEKAIKRMDDRAWLRAMRCRTSDEDREVGPRGRDRGSIEASRAQAAAKDDPQRFLNLVLDKMDRTFPVEYPVAILSGLAEAGVPAEDFEKVIRKYLPQLEEGHVGRVSSAIGKYAEMGITPYMLSLLKSWVHPPCKASASGEPTEALSRAEGAHQDLLTDGINTPRGAALWTIASILLRGDTPRRAEYLEIGESVVRDSSPALRAVAIHFLQYAIPADPGRSSKAFAALVGEDDTLLRERGAHDFVYRCLHRHSQDVHWAIERMLADAQSDQAREGGAKLACLAAFESPAMVPLRDACMEGDVPMRKGAAAVYAANITDPQVGEECRQRLPRFWDDENGEVRREATAFLRELEPICRPELHDFLRQWLQTKSLEEGADNAAYMVEHHPLVDPQLTLDIAHRLSDVLGREITSAQSRHRMISYHLTPAILNVYNGSFDAKVRARAMDLFEKLERLGCREVPSVMESVDRL